MKRNSIEQRRHRYSKLSSHLAQIESAKLPSIFESAKTDRGWGKNHVLEVGNEKVFVKRLPVTDLEVENLFSTANHYSLPVYYNYGVGSAGFGAFRELVANIKTTNWVLAGEIETFPLLYHYRLIPFSGERAPVDMDKHREYIDYWGGDESIGRYMLDRATASHELVLFLEFFPYVLKPWLEEHSGRTDQMVAQLLDNIDFLRRRGIIHFDAHLVNVVTDGKRPYVTDFGLVLDRSFALSEEEKKFYKQNIYYDYGRVLSFIPALWEGPYRSLPEEQQRHLATKYSKDSTDLWDVVRAMFDNIEEVDASGEMSQWPGLLNCMLKHRKAIRLMRSFYSDLRESKVNAKFPHRQLHKLLVDEGTIGASCR